MATTQQPHAPIQTQHCRFCNHLLLATTRTLSTLPRRGEGAMDKAVIIPLENGDTETELEAEAEAGAENEADTQAQAEESESPSTAQTQTQAGTKTKRKGKPKHTTLLLSTTIPDKRATLIRRDDGIEKRVLLRCGRCRVVVGYYLDKVHWETTNRKMGVGGGAGEGLDGDEGEERPPAVYVLPGALVETEGMGGSGGVGEREWRGWDV